MGGAIEELEKEGKVLVTRTVGTGEREGQMKAVFLDEVGNAGKVDKGAFFAAFEEEARAHERLGEQSSRICGARSRRP